MSIGFDENLEKYEDAVGLYDAYVRAELPDVETALLFILKSFPRVAEKLRDEQSEFLRSSPLYQARTAQVKPRPGNRRSGAEEYVHLQLVPPRINFSGTSL